MKRDSQSFGKALFSYLQRHKIISLFTLLVLVFSTGLLAAFITFPRPLFDDPTSTIITDRGGRLLHAQIADDGQWRFPQSEEIPEPFKSAILTFEDRYFYLHPGINPVAIGRAFYLNVKNGYIVSGGSTISMQVMRLARKQQQRTITEKLIELFYTIVLELTHSKDEILSFYASHAPFGGNVVGLDAAAWRYYGRPANNLSHAEAAALAVLPNQPSVIFPGKNEHQFKEKRDQLLHELRDTEILSENELKLAQLEPTPQAPKNLPQITPHLLSRSLESGQKGSHIKTTIDAGFQERVQELVNQHINRLSANNIHNSAVLVAEVETGAVKAYVGNGTVAAPSQKHHGDQVDVISAPRSSGSILKPFLYMWMMDQGELLPTTLVRDIPTNYAGYAPENYNQTYQGLVPANEALASSLNVPAVRLLHQFGQPRFYHYLEKSGLTTLHREADDYGLTLILGGAEAKLWDLVGMYQLFASAFRQEVNPSDGSVTIPISDIYVQSNSTVSDKNGGGKSDSIRVNLGAVWHTLEALKMVKRPDQEQFWEQFSSSRNVAWKTGTSFGHRDAWAVGITPDYIIGVWAGNADGEGRPGLTGLSSAAPLLFDVVNMLPESQWFEEPQYAMTSTEICTESGYRAGRFCTDKQSRWIPVSGAASELCPFHQPVYLTPDEQYQVSSACFDLTLAQRENRLALPPVEGWYYANYHSDYHPLPPHLPGCDENLSDQKKLEIIYPDSHAKLFLPVEVDGNKEKVIFEAKHQQADATLYWHLNDQYVEQTHKSHQIALTLEPGKYQLTITDQQGVTAKRTFEVIGSE